MNNLVDTLLNWNCLVLRFFFFRQTRKVFHCGENSKRKNQITPPATKHNTFSQWMLPSATETESETESRKLAGCRALWKLCWWTQYSSKRVRKPEGGSEKSKRVRKTLKRTKIRKFCAKRREKSTFLWGKCYEIHRENGGVALYILHILFILAELKCFIWSEAKRKISLITATTAQRTHIQSG